MKRVIRVAVPLCLVLVAACGKGTTTPDLGPLDLSPVLYPSVSGVEPSSVFVARTVDVNLSGYDTRWDATTKVDFGSGITVNKMTVASPSALQVNITVAETATLGARDITVTEGATGEPYKMAFHVESPIEVTFEGTQAQGSIVIAHIINHDFLNPFDTYTTGDGFTSPIEYPHIDVTASANGTAVSVTNVQPFEVDVSINVDVKADVGASDLGLLSGPVGATTSFPAPAALAIAARTATALSATTPATGTITDPYDSDLFIYTPAEGTHIVEIVLDTSSASAAPELIVLPKSGAFADVLSFTVDGFLLPRSADPYYAVLYEPNGVGSYPFTITTTSSSVTTATEVEPNDDKAHAMPVSALPFGLLDATLKDANDLDWLAVPIAAADVGKSVHVITLAGDPLTDTVVDVFDTDGMTSLGGPSADDTYQEDFLSSPTTKMGTVYVQISASTQFDPAHKSYDAIVRLE